MNGLPHGRENDPLAATGPPASEGGLDAPASDLLGIVQSILSQAPVIASLIASIEVASGHRPPNWPGDIDVARVVAVIRDDGLPLTWAPRCAVVTELLLAPDKAARLAVLLTHASEIAADCRDVLADVTHATLTQQRPLALKAAAALEAGHHEAAMALSVVITDSIVARFISPTYEIVKRAVRFGTDTTAVPYGEVRRRAALAPVEPFYASWHPASGAPMPEGLSRHVAVHRATVEHFTHANAVVAVLLMTSVMRTLQEDQERSPKPVDGRVDLGRWTAAT